MEVSYSFRQQFRDQEGWTGSRAVTAGTVSMTFPWDSDFKVVLNLGLTLRWLQLGHSQTEREAGKCSITCQEFHP